VKSPAELTDLFRARGLKVTPQRERIFRILHDAHDHPTAEAVHAAARGDMPTMSLRTVYQTLNDLTEMGELSALQLGTGSARFDPNLEPHHHLVCTSCGAVVDLHVDFPDVRVPARANPGFAVHGTEITFRGTCPDCVATDHAGGDGLIPQQAQPTNK
jgi:Fe2+ or Zn2+ uptake regulation protein